MAETCVHGCSAWLHARNLWPGTVKCRQWHSAYNILASSRISPQGQRRTSASIALVPTFTGSTRAQRAPQGTAPATAHRGHLRASRGAGFGSDVRRRGRRAGSSRRRARLLARGHERPRCRRSVRLLALLRYGAQRATWHDPSLARLLRVAWVSWTPPPVVATRCILWARLVRGPVRRRHIVRRGLAATCVEAHRIAHGSQSVSRTLNIPIDSIEKKSKSLA
jgi:hypothetical protein